MENVNLTGYASIDQLRQNSCSESLKQMALPLTAVGKIVFLTPESEVGNV